VITGNGLNKIKPPTYDSQTSWATYQLQFETAANANGWQTLPIAQQSNYQALGAALERRYGVQHRKEVYQTQLKARQQKTGENLQEFEAEIRRFMHLASTQPSRMKSKKNLWHSIL